MKTNNIDFLFKTAVEKSQDFYNEQAENSKLDIWHSVQKGVNKNTSRNIILSLSAACICLIALSSTLWLKLLNTENNNFTIASTTHYSKSQFLDYGESSNSISGIASKNTIDTIYINTQEIILQPIEKISYKTDTVIVTETVYLTNEPFIVSDDNINMSDTQSNYPSTQNLSNNKSIIISNENSEKRGKMKKFRFGFGSNSNEVNTSTLAISAKL